MCGLCSLTTRWVCSDNFSDTEFSVLSFPLEPKKKRFSRCFSTLHLTDDISDMGDSGAWVVDAATGDLYGVIVAASTVMQEGYLIPASEITKDIQRATGVPTVKLPKRADFNHTLQYSKDVESIDGLFTAGAAVDYKNRHQITYDRQSRTDHEPRQPNAIQASHLDERQEETHSGNTIASHSQISETVLGKERPDTPASMNNLAVVLSRQGKYKEAEEMHRQVLASRETVLGMEHPDTLTSVYCLAYLLHQEERYEDAKVLYHRAYAGYTKTLGENHPTTAACSEHYSSMLREEGLNIM